MSGHRRFWSIAVIAVLEIFALTAHIAAAPHPRPPFAEETGQGRAEGGR